METQRKQYPEDHWLRSHDQEKAFQAYMEQQGKAYSQIKNAFIEELLGDLTDKNVLDYGCGGGMFTVLAARKGAARVVGVDAEESVLDTARYFARKGGVERVCSFIRRTTFPLFSPTAKFDVILMKDVIEHVEDDERLLDDAADAIVPGGTIVVSTQNSFSLNYFVEGIYRRHIRGDKDWYGWDETHVRFYTPMSLQSKLRRSGFRVEAWRSAYLIPYKLPGLSLSRKKFLRVDSLGWIDKALGGVFPYNRLGWNIMVKARASSLVTEQIRLREEVEERLQGSPMLVTKQSLRFP